ITRGSTWVLPPGPVTVRVAGDTTVSPIAKSKMSASAAVVISAVEVMSIGPIPPPSAHRRLPVSLRSSPPLPASAMMAEQGSWRSASAVRSAALPQTKGPQHGEAAWNFAQVRNYPWRNRRDPVLRKRGSGADRAGELQLVDRYTVGVVRHCS